MPEASIERSARGPRQLDKVELAGLLAVVVLLVFFYRTTAGSLFANWRSQSNAHGMLIPFISGYLIWTLRARLASLPRRPTLLGAAGLALGLLIFFVGQVAGINNLRLASVPVVLGSLVALNFGLAHLRVVAVPLALLFLTGRAPAPLVTAISLPLQLLAAKVATLCLATLGIPVLREGNVIVLARTSLEVAEACSGLRSFEALLIMSGILAYLSRSSVWKGAALVLMSVPIAIVVNVGRVTITGIMAQLFGRRAAEGFYHSFTGWVAFVAALALLFLVSRLMARLPARPRAGTIPPAPGAPQVSA